MKTVDLKLIATTHLAEIFQSVDIKFSFVNKKMEQVTVPAKCRGRRTTIQQSGWVRQG